MTLKIIAIGELSGWAKQAYDSYAKRLTGPFAVKSIQIPTPKRNKQAKASDCMNIEEQKISKWLEPQDFVIALDQHGKIMTTEQFAENLQQWMQQKPCFILGGPDGISPTLQQRAQAKLSLSPMVLPHAMARIVLIEQIYRAYTITTNHPYHRA